MSPTYLVSATAGLIAASEVQTVDTYYSLQIEGCKGSKILTPLQLFNIPSPLLMIQFNGETQPEGRR